MKNTPYDETEQRLVQSIFGKVNGIESIVEMLKYDLALDPSKEHRDFMQHEYNPLHVYCRFRNLFPNCEEKVMEFASKVYEPNIRSVLYK